MRAFEGYRTSTVAGGESITTPQVVRHTPSPNSEFEKGMDGNKFNLYLMGRQLHRLALSGVTVVSGESRVQATNDFISSLGPTGAQFERAVCWLGDTVLRLAAYLAGQPGRYGALKMTCKVKYSAVQPTADMIRALTAVREADAIDTISFLEAIGMTNDVDATIQRMRAEGILEAGAADRIKLLMELAEKQLIPTEIVVRVVQQMGILPEDAKTQQDIAAWLERRNTTIDVGDFVTTPRSKETGLL